MVMLTEVQEDDEEDDAVEMFQPVVKPAAKFLAHSGRLKTTITPSLNPWVYSQKLKTAPSAAGGLGAWGRYKQY